MSPYPISFGTWSSSSGEPLSAEQQSLNDDVSRILGKSPTEAHIRAQGNNLTLEVGFEDASKVIARKIIQAQDETDLGIKLQTEARLLRWLAASTNIPIPRILSPLEVRNIIIMDKLPGAMLLNTYGTLDTSAKERLVEAYAVIALDLFELDVPQRIGTFAPDVLSGSLDVIPMIAIHFRANKVFEDIREYLDFLYEMKKSSPLVRVDDGSHIHLLDELKLHTESALTDLLSNPNAGTLLRCVLVHRDLNDTNILIDDDGSITGVIDWEYQALQPAVLAANYPPWLLYEGLHDPRFVNPKETLWLESPEESKRLRDLYLKIVKSRNYKYWEALVLGSQFRSCVEWLLNPTSDPGCEKIKQWMKATF